MKRRPCVSVGTLSATVSLTASSTSHHSCVILGFASRHASTSGLSSSSMPRSLSFLTVLSVSTVFRAKRETDFVTIRSVLSGYLIQCNDETGNPINDLNRGSKVSHLLEGRFIVEMCFHAQEKRLQRDAKRAAAGISSPGAAQSHFIVLFIPQAQTRSFRGSGSTPPHCFPPHRTRTPSRSRRTRPRPARSLPGCGSA